MDQLTIIIKSQRKSTLLPYIAADKTNSFYKVTKEKYIELMKQNSTTLSSYIWELKDKNLDYNIKWTAVDRAPRFNPITKKCRLCLKEKYYIIFQPEGAELNERSELFSTCRHRTRDLLSNVQTYFHLSSEKKTLTPKNVK